MSLCLAVIAAGAWSCADTGASSITSVVPHVSFDGTGSATWPAQPPGLIAVSERPFSALSEAQWHDQPSSTFSIVQDATAPRSAPGVGEARFPAGFTGGNAPMTNYLELPADARAIYLSFWLELSPNFQGHSSEQNKILYFTLADRFRATFNATGAAGAPLRPTIELRDVTRTASYRLAPNVGSGEIVRGRWQRWELVLRANTDANADGRVDAWVDGAHIIAYDSIQFVPAAANHSWQTVVWAPYWGASGDRVVADQFMRMDHMYVSAGTPAAAPPPPPTTVCAVTVTAPRSTLLVGERLQLSASAVDCTGAPVAGSTVAWSSSAPSIASVDSTGLVSARGAGSATITASSGGRSGAATLTVSPLPVASVSVTPAASTLTVGQGTQLAALLRDSTGATLSGRVVTWTSSNASVAGVSSSGYVTALAAGGATITATSEGKSGSATITVTAPASAPGTNEPAGLTLISDRHFAALNEAGWTDYKATNFSLVPDATSPTPTSQGTVGQVLYPAGFPGGTEPVNLYVPLGSQGTTLYLAFWFKMSPNFYGHPYSSVNKIFHVWIGGANRVYLAAMGAGNEPTFQPQVRLQQVPNQANYNLGPNLAAATTFVRDRWYKWEVVLRANTPGASDGSVECWIDGVKVASHQNVAFVAAGQGNRWEALNWAPTWGGVYGTVPADQWMRISRIYLSGR